MLNVINIRRPLSGTVERIIRLQEEMQVHSRLNITGLINNTNLAQGTTEKELRDGYEMIRQVSDGKWRSVTMAGIHNTRATLSLFGRFKAFYLSSHILQQRGS